jgi:hypothetical protein
VIKAFVFLEKTMEGGGERLYTILNDIEEVNTDVERILLQGKVIS